ncbi:MAG: aldose epimerase, partial [Kamptonema sp. SIO4C4]|nr:aldose epimerase [Kamptonema sp. SIO4C4]
RYSDIYSTLVFWTVQGKDYCCLEPWSSPRNALNTKENLVYLDAGETCEAAVEMEISYLNQSS